MPLIIIELRVAKRALVNHPPILRDEKHRAGNQCAD